MKRLLTWAFLAMVAICGSAQTAADEDDYYNTWLVGYASSGGIGDGAFLQMATSRRIVHGLHLDMGGRVRYTYYHVDIPYLDKTVSMQTLDGKVLVGLSYRFDVNEKFSLIPVSTAEIGVAAPLTGEGSRAKFAMGWDFGLRMRYKKFAMYYAYTVNVKNQVGVHSVGFGIGY